MLTMLQIHCVWVKSRCHFLWVSKPVWRVRDCCCSGHAPYDGVRCCYPAELRYRQTGDKAAVGFQTHSCPLTPPLYMQSYPAHILSVASVLTLQELYAVCPVFLQIVPSHPHLSPPRGPQSSIVVRIIYDLVFSLSTRSTGWVRLVFLFL